MDNYSDISVADESVKRPGSRARKSAKSKGPTVRSSSARRSSVPPPTLQEMQTDMLRRTYRGLTSPSPAESFTNLDTKQKLNAPYLSTSHFLRQVAGIEREKSSDQLTSRVSARAPQYKTQEEYYDEVLALKKQIQELNNDNSMLKLKLRRTEEDFIKKKREVEQLLDPVKNDQVRRTLAESKPDSGMVVHSLKQKMLKLEEQVREKELAYSKLQSDLKTTKFEEMKIALEVCYNEIQRLRNEKNAPSGPTPRKQSVPKDHSQASKLKGLTAQLMKANVERNRLIAENKSLREDLVRCMESKQDRTSLRTRREYDDMNKKELLAVIARLEKKSDRTDSGPADNTQKSSQIDEGKLPLEGTVNQRLDQLDKRETELLQKLDQQANTMKKLKEDRTYYRAKCDEKDVEIKSLRKELEHVQRELDKCLANSKSASQSKSPRAVESNSNRRSSSADGVHDKVDRHKYDSGSDEETAAILQSTLRGHAARQRTAAKLRKNSVGGSDRGPNNALHHAAASDSSDFDEAAELLQSNMRAHQYRKQLLSRRPSADSPRHSRPSSRSASRGGSDDEMRSIRSPGRITPSSQAKSRVGLSPSRANGDDYDDDVVISKGVRPKSAKIF